MSVHFIYVVARRSIYNALMFPIVINCYSLCIVKLFWIIWKSARQGSRKTSYIGHPISDFYLCMRLSNVVRMISTSACAKIFLRPFAQRVVSVQMSANRGLCDKTSNRSNPVGYGITSAVLRRRLIICKTMATMTCVTLFTDEYNIMIIIETHAGTNNVTLNRRRTRRYTVTK